VSRGPSAFRPSARLRHHLRVGLVLAGAVRAIPGAAQPPSGLELHWEAPDGCPQVEEVQARIDAIAGSAMQRTSHLAADARVTQEQARFHLKLVVRDGEVMGERNISSSSCADLAGAAAVALGLLLRSEVPLSDSALAGSDTPPAAPTAVPAPAPAPVPAPTEPKTPPPDAETGREARLRAIVRAPVGVVELGPLPAASMALGAGVGLRYDRWRVLLGARIWLDQSVSGPDFPEQGATIQRQSVALTFSRSFRSNRLEAAPQLKLSVERLQARGTGPGVTPTEEQVLWLAPGAGAVGFFHLGASLALVAEVTGSVETSRPVIELDGLGRVRKLGAFALDASAGVEWAF
jgi:hypothetical protein